MHDHKHQSNHSDLSHGHDHGHHHHNIERMTSVLWFAVLLTLLFSGVEAFMGWLAHSLALLSDAGHMFADSLSLVLAAVAAWVSQRPPSDRHSFGMGRAEVLAALISSIFVFLVVVGLAVEAVRRLQDPQPVGGTMVMITAMIGLLVNIILAYLLSGGHGTLNSRAALLHVLGDLLGSVAALIAGAVIYYTHWLPIDPILSLFVSVLILISSMRLLRNTFLVLMESVPNHLVLEQVGRTMAGTAKVRSVHDLHVWTLSSGTIMLSAHIILNDMRDWEAVLQQLKTLLRDRYKIEHITLQPEINVQVLKQMPRE